MVEQALIVVEPEQQRADDWLALVVAEAADHAVGAAVVLDLLHAGAVAGLIRQVAPLGDDAVERRADLLEPFLGIGESRGRRRQPDRSCAREDILLRECFQPLAPLARAAASGQRSSPSVGQQIEHDQQRRRLLARASSRGSPPDESAAAARRTRSACLGHDDLAIEHEALGLQRRAARRPSRENSASAAGRISIATRPCSPSRKTRQRKPSHFGSYCQLVALRDRRPRRALPSAGRAGERQGHAPPTRQRRCGWAPAPLSNTALNRPP